MRTEAEAAAILARFEAEQGVLDLTIGDVSVWRLIRFPVGLALQGIPFAARPLPRHELLIAFLRSLRDMAFLPPSARFVVKSFISALRIPGPHGYQDIYFERLLSEVPGGVRLYSVNAPGYSGRTCSAMVPSVDCTAVLIIGALLAKLFPVRERRDVFSRVGELVESHLGVAGFPAGRIRRMFSSFWWQSRLYAWLLRRLGPRTVLVADTGERALLSACRRLDIRFVELQHGIFTANHPDSLPAAVANADTAPLLLPDVVALYGNYWYGRLEHTALGKLGRLRSVGASVLENFRRLRQRAFQPSAACPRLIVTTQGVDRDALIQFLAEFLSQYRGPCQLTVKLHPAYDSALAPYGRILGIDPRVRIVRGSDDPNTYELLAESDLHLSIASACHYDALGIGVPTLVIGLAGHSLVEDLIDSGDALLARDAADLVEIVSRRGWAPVASAVSDKYYRHGFVDNLLPFIA